MTGLALAYFLGRAGFRTTIIEKGQALSGLLAFTTVESVPVERYYHHFFTHDNYQIALMEELGLQDQILWRESASAVYQGGQLYPFVTKADYLRLPFLSWSAKLRAGLAALTVRNQIPENFPPQLTAEDYLKKLFGRAGWETMWRPLLVNKFGEEDSRRISAQWIAKRIQIRAGSSRSGREVLGYINGSYKVLADRLVEVIKHQGGRIELNAEVRSLPRTAAGGYSINGQEYDVVVSTIAPNLIKRVIPELDLPEVTYRSAIVPLLVLRRQITPYYWMNILDPNMPFSVVVNQQALLPANYYRGRWPMYVGHYVASDSPSLEKTDQELREYYLGYLRQIFPGIDKEIISYEIGKAKHTQPVVKAPWQPLQHTTNIPNLYMTSMAHIFPEDRGVNYSIREAKRITELLQDNEKNNHDILSP